MAILPSPLTLSRLLVASPEGLAAARGRGDPDAPNGGDAEEALRAADCASFSAIVDEHQRTNGYPAGVARGKVPEGVFSVVDHDFVQRCRGWVYGLHNRQTGQRVPWAALVCSEHGVGGAGHAGGPQGRPFLTRLPFDALCFLLHHAPRLLPAGVARRLRGLKTRALPLGRADCIELLPDDTATKLVSALALLGDMQPCPPAPAAGDPLAAAGPGSGGQGPVPAVRGAGVPRVRLTVGSDGRWALSPPLCAECSAALVRVHLASAGSSEFAGSVFAPGLI